MFFSVRESRLGSGFFQVLVDTTSKLLDTESVKVLTLEHGFDKVGIVSAEDFDFPAWVHSAIVLGYVTLDDAYDYEMFI